MHSMKQHGWKWVIRLCGLVIFVVILSSINIPATVQILFNVNIFLLILGLLMIFPQIYFRAWRWHLLMNMQNISYPLKDAVTVYFAALFVGTITPGRLGELIKVQYLMDEGYSFGRSFLSVLLDRCYDLGALLFVGYISIIYFIQFFSERVFLVSTIFILIPLVGVVICLMGIVKKDHIIRVIIFLSPLRFRETLLKTLHDFFDDFSSMKTRPLVIAFLMTMASWVFYYIMAYCFALALVTPVSFFYLVGCVSVAAFITLLPVSISGIGTRDAVLILLFGYAGISSESAVAYSLLLLFMYVINGCIGFIAWQNKPVSLKLWNEETP
jgi:glycosyltransferase 2 family protein